VRGNRTIVWSEILEEAGGYVVEDDLLLGWPWFTWDVATDPFERFGRAYVHVATPITIVSMKPSRSRCTWAVMSGRGGYAPTTNCATIMEPPNPRPVKRKTKLVLM